MKNFHQVNSTTYILLWHFCQSHYQLLSIFVGHIYLAFLFGSAIARTPHIVSVSVTSSLKLRCLRTLSHPWLSVAGADERREGFCSFFLASARLILICQQNVMFNLDLRTNNICYDVDFWEKKLPAFLIFIYTKIYNCTR